MSGLIWSPSVVEKFDLGSHMIFTVRSDRVFDRAKPECIGWTVMLEGKLWTIVGVSRNMPATPILPGEVIALKVTLALVSS